MHSIFMKRNMTMDKKNYNCNHYKSCGGIYGLGFLGAAIYYISVAGSFWAGVLGVLKALVWPALLVYELFKFLGI